MKLPLSIILSLAWLVLLVLGLVGLSVYGLLFAPFTLKVTIAVIWSVIFTTVSLITLFDKIERVD